MPRLLLLLSTLLLCVHLTLAEGRNPEPLHLHRIPGVGDGPRLGYLLLKDAERLREAKPELCAVFESSETALLNGDPVLACAQALVLKETASKPEDQARAQLRLGRSLIQAGDLTEGLTHVNEALAVNELHGEIFLAQASALARNGLFEQARDYLVQASAASSAAPKKAREALQGEFDRRATQIQAFKLADEPKDPSSPEFLAYAELALAAGAFSKADVLSDRAITSLLQDSLAYPDTPPELRRRAWLCKREALAGLIEPSFRPEATGTWAYYAYIARAACNHGAGRPEYERYLSLLAKALAGMPRFDFALFNLHQDLQTAEKLGVSQALREIFKPLLAQPRQRYASRLLSCLDAYEALPAAGELYVSGEATMSEEELPGLRKLNEFLEAEEKSLAELRNQLPSDAPPVEAERTYQETLARVRFLSCLDSQDYAGAKAQVSLLEKLPNSDAIHDLDRCRTALGRLREKAFIALVQKLDTLPPSELSAQPLSEAALEALFVENQLQLRHGRNHLDKTGLEADDLQLQRSLSHLRLLQACTLNRVLSAEGHLAVLEALNTPDRGPAYAPLTRCIERVATLRPDPATEPELKQLFTEALTPWITDEQLEFLGAVIEEEESPSTDPFAEAVLRSLVLLRSGWIEEAGNEFRELRAQLRHNTFAQEYLARLETDYAPERTLDDALNTYRSAAGEAKKTQARKLMVLGTRYLKAMAEDVRKDWAAQPERLSPAQRRLFTDSSLAISLASSQAGDLLTASLYLRPLKLLKAESALQEASLALRDLPLHADFPDEASGQLWNDLPRIHTLPKERTQAYAALLQKGRTHSLCLRFAQSFWRLRLLQWEQTAQALREQRDLLGANLACSEALTQMEATLENCRQLHEATKGQLEEIKKERLRYYNDYRSTVTRLNAESESSHQRNAELVSQAKSIEAALSAGQLSYSEAISQLERLAALQEGGPNEVYKQRDRQRSLNFLEEAKQKIAAYDGQLKDLERQYHSGLDARMSGLHQSLSARILAATK